MTDPSKLPPPPVRLRIQRKEGREWVDVFITDDYEARWNRRIRYRVRPRSAHRWGPGWLNRSYPR